MNASIKRRTARRPHHIRAALLPLLALGIAATPAWTAPRARAATQRESVTITLAGPNQWNDSGTSFGKAWEDQVAAFQKATPGVIFKTNVLPLTSFFAYEATLLQAGSAPELIFNQTNYKPFQVVPLTKYLMQPNPYAPGNKRWLDLFDPRAFNAKQQNTNGNWDWVPFNLFDTGLFINQTAFAKAGIKYPISTFEEWRTDSVKLKAAGYTALAADGSYLGVDIAFQTLANMLLAKYFDTWNVYLSNGVKGSSNPLVLEDYVRAVKTGVDIAHLPEFSESLTLLKEMYDKDSTPNWSSIKGLSGAGVNLADFEAGKAAMAWGSDFGVSALQAAHLTFKVGSIGFPTVTKATTPLSQNFPAQFGVAAGGTSYMIPATTKGAKLDYAIKFLQFMTAPRTSQAWITATTAAPAVRGVAAPASISGFSAGQWGVQAKMNTNVLPGLSPQATTEFQQIIQGYLLGSSSLSATEDQLQTSWKRAADYQIVQNPKWKSESWAK